MAPGAEKSVVLPVTLKQKYLLDQAIHPDCPDDLRDRWVLSLAHLVQPGIDMRRLRRAVTKLRQRHDSLRLRFKHIKGVWRAQIDPPGGDLVQQIDLGTLDDAAFMARVSEIANAPMQVVDTPMVEIIVAKAGTRGDVLITRLHHTITDGYGMVILTEDLTKLLIGLPILGKAVSFSDYLTRFHLPLPGQRATFDAHWHKVHAQLPLAPDVGRKGKGLAPLPRALGEIDHREMKIRATAPSLRRFEARAAAQNISTTTVFFAAHLEALCQCYNLARLAFTTHISRTDVALDAYIGDHTQDVILPFVAGGTAGFEAAVERLRDSLQESMAHLPHESARRGTPYETALIEAGIFSSQFSVHHPRAMIRQNRSVFKQGFDAKYGEEQKIGPYTLTSLDVTPRRRVPFEMQLLLSAEPICDGFEIHFDGIAFTEEEVRRVAAKSCELLELDMIDAVIS